MIFDLGWWRLTEVRAAFPISDTSFRAPSWSWASVDGETIFPSNYGGVRARFVKIEEVLKPVTNETNDSMIGTAIRVRGCCLPLSVEWPDERISSFKVAGVHFHVGDSSEGSLISLETQKEAMRYHLGGRLLLLPLFATTYFIHGIVLTKIRGVCAYHRLGAVEIPVMMKPGFNTSQAASGEIDQDEEWHRFQRNGWVREMPQSVNQSAPVNHLWSVAAVKIIRYLLSEQRTQRIIDIH